MFTGLNLNRLAAYAVLLVLILGAVFLGIQQYGNSRVAAQELSTLQKASMEAVAARTGALVQDVQQSKENSTKRERVRLVLKEKRDAIQEAPDCVGDAERIRLLNDAVRAVNAVVTTSGELPERL